MATTTAFPFEASAIPIKSVLCYRDQAELYREFEVALVPGTNKVIVEKVSHSINSSTIRVDGEGDAILRDVQYKEEYAKEDEVFSEELKLLKQKLEVLNEEAAVLEDRTKALNVRNEALDSLLQTIVAPKNTEKPIEYTPTVGKSYSDAFEYHEAQKTLVAQRLRTTAKQQQVLQKEMDVLLQKINEQQIQSNVKRQIIITLDSVAGGAVLVKLTYAVRNAFWVTSYDARVDSKTKKVKLHYFATLNQTSGEDWNDVDLSLSTAEPQEAGSLPELPPLKVSFEEKFTPESGSLFGGAPQNVCFAAAAAPRMMKRSIMAYDVSVNQNLLSTTYAIPVKRTILSKHDETRVTIAVLDLPYELQHITVPIKRSHVFLVAYLHNITEYHLLDGPIKVYIDNSFSNTVHLPQIAIGQHFKLELGTDPSIKIEVKPKNTLQQQTGVLTKSTNVVHEQKVVVINNKAEHITLTVLEQVPKSTDEKIKIKLIHPEAKVHPTQTVKSDEWKKPELGAVLNDNNILEWTLDVEPGSKHELLLKYAVEHPPTETVQFREY